MIDWIDIDLLQLSPAISRDGMPRITANDLEQMRACGPVVPVSARPVGAGRYEILAGAETWLCAQRLGQHKVPVFFVEDLDEEQAAAVAQRRRDPISEAEDFAGQLKKWHGARRGRITGLARLLGLNRPYVAHALRLLKLPDSIQQAVRTGKLSAGHARALLRLPTGQQSAAARRMLRESMTVRQAEAFVRGDAKTAGRSSDVVSLENRVSQVLGCDFTISEGEGTCTINYYKDLEILDGVLEKLGCQ